MIKKSSSKKAQLEISFNWIFVLIAGGAILFFFIMLITNQGNQADSDLAQLVTERLKTIIAASEKNIDTVKNLPALNAEMELSCKEGVLHYGVRDSSYLTEMETSMIFAPHILGNSKLKLWSSKFKTGYPITSVLYMTDENTVYLFVSNNNPGEIEDLYKSFPSQFNKKLVNTNDVRFNLTPDNYRQFIMVVDDDVTFNLINPSPAVESITTIVEIDPDFGNIKYSGKIRFHNFVAGAKNQLAEIPYVSNELLIGAIVSGDPDIYQCTLDKVLERTKIVSQIYIDRTNNIGQQYTVGDCTTYYGSVSAPGTLITSIMQGIKDSTDDFSDLSTTSYSDLLDNIDKMEILDLEVSSRTSCPHIY